MYVLVYLVCSYLCRFFVDIEIISVLNWTCIKLLFLCIGVFTCGFVFWYEKNWVSLGNLKSFSIFCCFFPVHVVIYFCVKDLLLFNSSRSEFKSIY